MGEVRQIAGREPRVERGSVDGCGRAELGGEPRCDPVGRYACEVDAANLEELALDRLDRSAIADEVRRKRSAVVSDRERGLPVVRERDPVEWTERASREREQEAAIERLDVILRLATARGAQEAQDAGIDDEPAYIRELVALGFGSRVRQRRGGREEPLALVARRFEMAGQRVRAERTGAAPWPALEPWWGGARWYALAALFIPPRAATSCTMPRR